MLRKHKHRQALPVAPPVCALNVSYRASARPCSVFRRNSNRLYSPHTLVQISRTNTPHEKMHHPPPPLPVTKTPPRTSNIHSRYDCVRGVAPQKLRTDRKKCAPYRNRNTTQLHKNALANQTRGPNPRSPWRPPPRPTPRHCLRPRHRRR